MAVGEVVERRVHPVDLLGPVLRLQLQEVLGLLWVLMITSARNPTWAGDIEINDLDMAGLPVPSVVRCAKIAAIETGSATPMA